MIDYRITYVEPIPSDYFPYSSPFRILLDTNILLDFILKNERYDTTKPLWHALNHLLSRGQLEFYTSSVCIVEAIYRLADLHWFKFRGEELLQQLAENIDDPVAIENLISESKADRQKILKIPSISKNLERSLSLLNKLLKDYLTVIPPIVEGDSIDQQLIKLAYKNNIQIQDFLVFVSAINATNMDMEIHMILTNDAKLSKKSHDMQKIDELEQYIMVRSLSNYKLALQTLSTLAKNGIINDNFEIIQLEFEEGDEV